MQIRKSQQFHHQLNAPSTSHQSHQAHQAHQAHQTHQAHQAHHSKAERSTTIMLIAYSASFLILQLPATLLYIFEFTYDGIFAVIGRQWTGTIEQVSNLLITLNSCTNFYIFFLFGSRFRHLVRRKFAIFLSVCNGKQVQFDLNSYGTSTPMTNMNMSHAQHAQILLLQGRGYRNPMRARSSMGLITGMLQDAPAKRRNSLL